MIVPENKNQKIHRVFIKLDEEKVKSNTRCELDVLNDGILKIAKNCHLFLNTDGWFEGKSENCDSFIITLLDSPWFIENVKEWKRWDVERNSIENGIEIYKKIGVL